MKSSHRLSIAVSPDEKEHALALLWELGTLGMSEQEEGETTRLEAYFSDRANAQAAMKLFADKEVGTDISLSENEERDWMAKWRESMRPAYLGDGIWVSPAWCVPRGENVRCWIKIEPKMTFGTGHHESTRLAASALIRCLYWRSARAGVLDVGTGSGVLCFAALSCGAKFCVGLDVDGACLPNIAENRTGNGGIGSARFFVGTVDALAAGARFHVVAMNIAYNLSAPLLPDISRLCVPDGDFIWSGLLGSDRGEALKAARANDFRLSAEIEDGEWWCGIFGPARGRVRAFSMQRRL